VGILKRLRGTPITRHDGAWEMVYSAHPPYELLRNKLLDFAAMQRLRRFARFWDLTANSGNFVETTPLIWSGGLSPFAAFLDFSEWIYERLGRRHGIALERLGESLFIYLTHRSGVTPRAAAQSLWRDWRRAGRRERPDFLAEHVADGPGNRGRSQAPAPKRQARHLGARE
jgi:hypothetical protein